MRKWPVEKEDSIKIGPKIDILVVFERQ